MKKINEVTHATLEDIGRYHTVITENDHLKMIAIFRDTRFADFGEIAREWVADLSTHTGLNLSPHIQKLKRDHIQIRTVRPGLTDFNPPHKDSYLDVWHNVINIWIPINYLGKQAIMPICPGSHLWTREILRALQ